MTKPSPLTYQLTIPPQFAAILNTKPTLVVGEEYAVIAVAPDLAAEAVKRLEEKASTWSPPSDFAPAVAGLPGSLMFVQATDPRETAPQAIVGLPAAIEKAIGRFVGALPGGAAPAGAVASAGSPPAGGPGAPSAAPAGGQGGPGAGTASPPPGYPGAGGGTNSQYAAQAPGGGGRRAGLAAPDDLPGGGGQGGPGAGTASPPPGYPGARGGPPSYGNTPGGAGAPAVAAATAGPVRFNLPPESMPTVESIGALLHPGAGALSVDEAGLHWVSREAFFDVASLTALLNGLASNPMAGGIPGLTPPAAAAPGMAAPPGGTGAPAGFPGIPGAPGGGPPQGGTGAPAGFPFPGGGTGGAPAASPDDDPGVPAGGGRPGRR
jgi:hypothetical protein